MIKKRCPKTDTLFVFGHLERTVLDYFCFGGLAPIIKMQLKTDKTSANIMNSISISVTDMVSPLMIGLTITNAVAMIIVWITEILAILFCSFDKFFQSFTGLLPFEMFILTSPCTF